MIDDELLYEEVHKLVRKEYDLQYTALQELVAEMVIKTSQHNRTDLQERHDKIMFYLLGYPEERIVSQDQQDFLYDLRRAACLTKRPLHLKDKSLSIGEAAAGVARQRILMGHKIGDKVPKDISDDDDVKWKSYARRIKRNLEKNNIDQLENEFTQQGEEEAEMLFGSEADVTFAKSLISLWLDFRCK